LRVDQALVERGLAASRSAAQRLILAGAVRVTDDRGARLVRRPAEAVGDASRLTVAASDENRYASRAGAKLDHALHASGADPSGACVLDIGQSSGGFTDCLLAHGARAVIGIDVGHGQLVARLRDDPRVRCREGVNARGLTPEALGADLPAGGFDWVVIDVSFISITLLLAGAARVAAPHATLMALIKPQFEVGQDGLDRRGLVRSPDLFPAMRESVQRCADASGWQRLGWYDSALAGGDGNREFFMHARRGA
jgi:23S rRNA (cytidine1920-2'-O)/16S rRNA (cytidine1409-2'-O)-methyltransferase